MFFPSSRQLVVAVVLAAAAFGASAQHTSIFPKDNNPDSGYRKPPAPDYLAYEYGKEIYDVKLGCASCPLANKPLDEASARKLLEDYEVWPLLSAKEEDAVRKYLKQRFAL